MGTYSGYTRNDVIRACRRIALANYTNDDAVLDAIHQELPIKPEETRSNLFSSLFPHEFDNEPTWVSTVLAVSRLEFDGCPAPTRAERNRPLLAELSRRVLSAPPVPYGHDGERTCSAARELGVELEPNVIIDSALAAAFVDAYPGIPLGGGWAAIARQVLKRVLRPVAEILKGVFCVPEVTGSERYDELTRAAFAECKRAGLQGDISVVTPHLVVLFNLAWPETDGWGWDHTLRHVLADSTSTPAICVGQRWRVKPDCGMRFNDLASPGLVVLAGDIVEVVRVDPSVEIATVRRDAGGEGPVTCAALREYFVLEAVPAPSPAEVQPPPEKPAGAPLTGYAAAHAEMLGVTPEQYRAGRAKLPTRRTRRMAYSLRCRAINAGVEVTKNPPRR